MNETKTVIVCPTCESERLRIWSLRAPKTDIRRDGWETSCFVVWRAQCADCGWISAERVNRVELSSDFKTITVEGSDGNV